MSLLTPTQQAELEKPVARTAYFLELQFQGGTSRLCSFNQTYTWGGYDWLGLGTVLGISEVEEGEGAQARPLAITITAADPAWMAVAVGPVEEYRGRPLRMYMAPLDETYQLVGTPALAWRGVMDRVEHGIQEDKGQVVIRCETAANALKRRQVARVNAAQHKNRHPGETGLDYLNDLIANPQLWLSKRFQSL